MKNNLFGSFLLLIVFFLAGFFLINQFSKNPIPQNIQNVGDIKYVKIAGVDVKVDLALTTAEQAQGLSGRQSLNADEGMLFVFNQPGQYYFWMKDMKIPLDMIWISDDLHVIYIKKNALPESYPEGYGPKEDAKYVLEVVSGFSDKNNLKVGDSVSFND